MNKEIFYMKRKHLLVGFIILGLSLLTTNVQAQDDNYQDILTQWLSSDHRTEIEKISDDPQLMEKYILSQKDVNIRFKEGKTFLHYASPKNYRDIVKLLLERGADINAADNDKRTPLHEAMSYKAFEVVRFLVENGANVNLENKDGETPLSSIVFWDHKKLAIEVVNLFIEKGFDLNKSPHATLLNEAIRRERRDISMIFLKNGIRFNDIALIEAARKGYEDIFNILLEKGANPQQKVTFHDTCESGNINIMRTLAVRGIKPSAEDIDFCLYNGHKEAAIHLNIMLKEEKSQQVEIKRRCYLKPSSGSCKAIFEGAYFDEKANVCREFTGCGGVFPFNNLEACKKVCEE